jgi:hypothetical protein
LFIYNFGGFDPFNALSPAWDRTFIEMPPAAGLATSGGLRWVDTGVDAVRTFFDTWHDRTHTIHGMQVPSVSHEVCTELLFTGLIGARRPDWPSQIAAAHSDRPVPSFVLAGPSFPGWLGTRVARVGGAGQLQQILDRSLYAISDTPLPPALPAAVSDLIRLRGAQTARARAELLAGRAGAAPFVDWADASQRSSDLVDSLSGLSLFAGTDFAGQLDVAVGLFENDLTRCVSTSTESYNLWDSHEENDEWQAMLNAKLYSQLDRVMHRLATTPSRAGGTLLDEVTIVCLTEMGRTPLYNSKKGRDHWPYASVLMCGAGIAGDGQTGGWDNSGFGEPIDLASGEPFAGGVIPTTEHFGATLLALAGEDPAETLPFNPPLASVLA